MKAKGVKMKNEIKKSWSDFDAMTTHILKIIMILGFMAYAITTEGIIIKIIAVILFLTIPFNAIYWPIRIACNKIVLAREGGFPLPRKAINFNDFEKIEVVDRQKCDEVGIRHVLTKYKVVKAINKNGTKYRNMITSSSVDKFKDFVNANAQGLGNKII